MTFSRTLFASMTAIALLAGCGGSDDTETSEIKKTVEERTVTAEASTIETPEPTVTPAAAEASNEFAGLPAPYTDADYARGKRTFKLCQACHTLAEGGPNLVGPNLYGIFGRQIGAVDGFTYSSAVAEADFVWSPEKLEEWLASPRDFLPGNKMAFAGVRKEPDRHAVIAYIMTETGYVAPSD